MRPVLLASLIMIVFFGVTTAEEIEFGDDVPYLYYYSNVLKGLVIERADGTDSRVLGRDMVVEDVQFNFGPGWSHDRTWFAWHVQTIDGNLTEGKGYTVHIDGTQQLTMLEDFSCVHNMYWHPTENILLVYGQLTYRQPCSQYPYPVATYWLIDVDNQTTLANFSINYSVEMLHRYLPELYWQPDDEMVQFRELIDVTLDGAWRMQYFLVSMHFDGTVHMESTSYEFLDDYFEDQIPDESSRIPDRQNHLFDYRLAPENIHKQYLENPPLNNNYDGGLAAELWNETDEWVLVGHEWCRAGCGSIVEGISIYHPETGYHREIANCGGHIACVGWLPEDVDLSLLPPGGDVSVLPAPVEINYSDDPSYSIFFSNIISHELHCRADNNIYGEVVDLQSEEIIYTATRPEHCVRPFSTPQPIIFALSPDEHYYAITDATEYTTLYLAETGQKIATLNFYGEILSFTSDSRYLITEGQTAIATWDIEHLIAYHMQPVDN